MTHSTPFHKTSSYFCKGILGVVHVFGMFWIGLTAAPAALASETLPMVQSSDQLRAVPHPQLSRLEPAAGEQILEARKRLESMAQARDVTGEKLSQAYGEMGKLYHVQDFLGAAQACYLNAQLLAPGAFRWSYYLGPIYKNKGEIEKSIASYERALQIRPKNIPALLGAAGGHLSLNRYALAQPLFEQALAVDESCAPALVGMGKIASSKRNTEEAIQYLEAALALQPNANSIHYLLAMSYRRQGNLGKARAHFQRVAMLERMRRGHATPGYPDPLLQDLDALKTGWRLHWTRGIRAFGKGRFAEAANQFRAAIALDPKNPIPRTDLGSALARLGDLEGAAQQYAVALRVSPGNPMLHYHLGTTLMGLHADEDAAEHYQAAIRSNPGFKEAHFQLANLLMRLRRYEKAIPHYATVIELDSGLGGQILPGDSGDGQLQQMNGLARFMQAMALIRLDRYGEALMVLEEGLQVFPGHADMTHALARLLAACPDHKIRNGGRALQLLQPLFEDQDGLDLESVETLAMALAETGQFERAVQVQHAMISDLEGNQRFDLVQLLAENLALYENGQPCRLPWREDDPIFSPVPAAMEPLAPGTSDPTGK